MKRFETTETKGTGTHRVVSVVVIVAMAIAGLMLLETASWAFGGLRPGTPPLRGFNTQTGFGTSTNPSYPYVIQYTSQPAVTGYTLLPQSPTVGGGPAPDSGALVSKYKGQAAMTSAGWTKKSGAGTARR